METLSAEMCHIGGGEHDGRRTLVIFLHGAIAKDTEWQFTQERALVRQAKQSGFEVLFPRAPLSKSGYVWSGIDGAESSLVDAWTAARKQLETRNGKAFDDVFVMGFSSGAYYASSLALRGRLNVDGYAVFAGGSPMAGPAADASRRPPVFVGVCADDPQTAQHSRAFGGVLAARGFPHRIDEQHIGHMFGDVHVAHAVSYLRGATTKGRTKSE